MTFDIKSAIAQAATTTPDMNVAQKGGGGAYTPPPEGVARARFVGYYELGDQTIKIPGKPDVVKPGVRLVFELSGGKYAPKVTDNGPIPLRISIDVSYSLNEKAWFYKIFKQMNWAGKAKHIAELLGEAYLVTIYHIKDAEGKVKYASLKGPAGYNIQPPQQYDAISETTTPIPVDPPITKLGLFLWGYPSKEMWDSIYIDGAYDDGKSKNVIQNEIKAAVNFQGSPIHVLLSSGTTSGLELGGGKAPTTPDDPSVGATPQPTNPAASTGLADPLAGLN
jgi:hypothetical protein